MTWLGYDRYRDPDFQPAESSGVWRRGVLRGVRAICLNRLERALTLHVVPGPVPRSHLVRERGDDEGYYVHLGDPQVDPCTCWDFIDRGHALATPCKHILAALLAEQHPYVTELVGDIQRRQAIAHAMEAPVADACTLS